MDLAKIIAVMREELQCLNTAISSMEQLARLENIAFEEPSLAPPSEGTGMPVKRPRGRPRKNPLPQAVASSTAASTEEPATPAS